MFDPQMVFRPRRLTKPSQIGTSKIEPIVDPKMVPWSSCSKTIRKQFRPRLENVHNKLTDASSDLFVIQLLHGANAVKQ